MTKKSKLPKNRKIPKLDKTAMLKLMDLRMFVDTVNRTPDLALRGGIYREIDKAEVFVQSFDGWEVGYKLEDHGVFMKRKVFIKCEQHLDEIPDDQKDPVFNAVMEVFIDRGQSLPEIEPIAPDAVLIQQNFMPLVQVERNPNLVSKGRQVH